MNKYSVEVENELNGFENDCKNMNNVLSLLWSDGMYSTQYKQQKHLEHVEALKNTAQKRVDNIKAIVKKAFDECPVNVPNDGKNHAVEVNNALLAIQILGADITAENLVNVLEPLRGSYDDIKTVGGILTNKISTSKVAFNNDILPLLNKYMMLDNGIGEFNSKKANVLSILNDMKLGFFEQTYSDRNTVLITCNMSYDVMNLPNLVDNIVELYQTGVKPGIEHFKSGKSYLHDNTL